HASGNGEHARDHQPKPGCTRAVAPGGKNDSSSNTARLRGEHEPSAIHQWNRLLVTKKEHEIGQNRGLRADKHRAGEDNAAHPGVSQTCEDRCQGRCPALGRPILPSGRGGCTIERAERETPPRATAAPTSNATRQLHMLAMIGSTAAAAAPPSGRPACR